MRMMAALTAAKVHLGVPPLLNAADEAPDDRCVLLYLALLKRAVTQREDTHFSASTPTAANQRSGQLSAADADGVQRHGRGSAAVNADAAARAGGEGLVRSGADLSEEELRRLQARHNSARPSTHKAALVFILCPCSSPSRIAAASATRSLTLL